ncbi:hypothetical protein Aple_010360 [Acrocarpospora pleiomorpha]|uniref:Uncharacterized protein n=1 Tax=Acrocarpospora pleiomorpha TaxID=90975 RepID=A0A5M3XEX9_9ACTN|nr:hypothetical protein [Acrocarpospora pleiomorpha]GES18141.1 hypothetical protein Aple_010360 [Acrocarpospora pleiomorpha]
MTFPATSSAILARARVIIEANPWPGPMSPFSDVDFTLPAAVWAASGEIAPVREIAVAADDVLRALAQHLRYSPATAARDLTRWSHMQTRDAALQAIDAVLAKTTSAEPAAAAPCGAPE